MPKTLELAYNAVIHRNAVVEHLILRLYMPYLIIYRQS